jgi:hypothetical protein
VLAGTKPVSSPALQRRTGSTGPNDARFYLYSGDIFLRLAEAHSNLTSNAISDTFFNGSSIGSVRGDLSIALTESRVASLPSGEYQVKLSSSEFDMLLSSVLAANFSSSGFVFFFGRHSVHLQMSHLGMEFIFLSLSYSLLQFLMATVATFRLSMSKTCFSM